MIAHKIINYFSESINILKRFLMKQFAYEVTAWNSNWICNESIKLPTASNNSLAEVLNYINIKLRVDHITLDLLKSSLLWITQKETSLNESLNIRLQAESWTCWKSRLKQEKHPYMWFLIEYSSINSGTYNNILWNSSRILMWSSSKDWKTGYVIKTGPMEKFL